MFLIINRLTQIFFNFFLRTHHFRCYSFCSFFNSELWTSKPVFPESASRIRYKLPRLACFDHQSFNSDFNHFKRDLQTFEVCRSLLRGVFGVLIINRLTQILIIVKSILHRFHLFYTTFTFFTPLSPFFTPLSPFFTPLSPFFTTLSPFFTILPPFRF